MVQSINTKSELVIEGTAFMGMPAYGKIMIGDKGFEFFNEKTYVTSIRFRGMKWTGSLLPSSSKVSGSRALPLKPKRMGRIRLQRKILSGFYVPFGCTFPPSELLSR